MNARLYPLLLLALAPACTEPNVRPIGAAGPPGDPYLPDAPLRGPTDDVWKHSQDAAAVLAERISDARAAAANEPDPRTDSPAWEAFYHPDAVHTVDISLSEESMDAISDDGRTWVPAHVVIDGQEYPDAGARRKGNTTWQSMSGKPSFKVKLHAFGDRGPRLAGLERLTLNNMVSDPSQARENIALRIWRELGVEASRGSWAVVTVNGEPYGLYSNLESPDDEWLQRRYVLYQGDLWEANDDADFTESGLPYWELSEGTGARSNLDTLAAVLDEGVEDWFADVAPYVDTEQFLAYWAACLVTGNGDGYPFKLNDTFVYSDPGDDGRLDFFPWSMDEAWGDQFSTYTAGELAKACADDPACEARQREVFVEMLGRLESLDVAGMVADSFATSDALSADDPRKPFSTAQVSAARAALAARIAGWPARIRAEAQ